MPKTRPPYAPEFRRQIVELVRAGRDPTDLAREFEPSAQASSASPSVFSTLRNLFVPPPPSRLTSGRPPIAGPASMLYRRGHDLTQGVLSENAA